MHRKTHSEGESEPLAESMSGFAGKVNHSRFIYFTMIILIGLSLIQLIFRVTGDKKEASLSLKGRYPPGLAFPALPSGTLSDLDNLLKLNAAISLLSSRDSLTSNDSMKLKEALLQMQHIETQLQQKLK
ncbi:hypothetical protein [Desertivirga brevis]|uniref:hypothetical protein n=1 Tax=Desertivirga brevis TaxID=2810310 RepID=UPI001A96CCB8|nr:hypothetical protein [Pedobacter sp. SYSU D00873]